jgi:hypothetical protein
MHTLHAELHSLMQARHQRFTAPAQPDRYESWAALASQSQKPFAATATADPLLTEREREGETQALQIEAVMHQLLQKTSISLILSFAIIPTLRIDKE